VVCLLTTQSQVHTQRKITALGDPELFSQRSPEGAEIKKFMSMVDEGRELPCGSASSMHVLTTLLMDYLAQLPNPIMTTYRYERFVKAAQNTDPLVRVRGIKNVVDTLPAHNRQLLTTLVRMWANIPLRISTLTRSEIFRFNF
jgi:hypothetical protein